MQFFIRLFALTLPLPLFACADPSLSTAQQEVVGGTVTPDGEHPAVGALVLGPFEGDYLHGCTGTLIAPDVVLTAAHCVAGLEGLIPSFTLSNDVSAQPTVVLGRAVVVHEDFVDAEPSDFLGDLHDIGLLLLAQPITDVTPVELIRADQAAALVPELALEIVGYGRTGDDARDEGVKRQATTALIELNASEMQVSLGGGQPQNCVGDSGGPSFADLGDGLQQVSVVSRSHATDDCLNGGIHTRVDPYLDWIADSIAAAAADDDEHGSGCAASSGQGPGAALMTLLLATVFGARRRRSYDQR